MRSNDEELIQLLKKIGAELKALRLKMGYRSHETFCYDFDLPRIQYWRMESGKANITLKSLQRILELHNLSFKAFFTKLRRTDLRFQRGQSL